MTRVLVRDWAPIPSHWRDMYPGDFPEGAYVLRLCVASQGRLWLGVATASRQERQHATLLCMKADNAWRALLRQFGEDLDGMAPAVN